MTSIPPASYSAALDIQQYAATRSDMVFPFLERIFHGAIVGNRTRIESSTSSSVDRYTTIAIKHKYV